MAKKIFNHMEWVLLAVSLLLGLSIALRSREAVINFFATDDAFYYFQTAKNAMQGAGLSFDGIARGNGYHPLWMLMCLPVFAFAPLSLWLPLRLLVVIHALLLAGSGYFLFGALSRLVPRWLALPGLAVWLFLPQVYVVAGTLGLENSLNGFFLMMLLYSAVRFEQGDPLHIGKLGGMRLMGVLAMLTLLSRLDNIFLVGLLGLWLVLKESAFERQLVIADILLAALAAVFSYFVRFRFTLLYYDMMEPIKLLVMLSLVLQPVLLAAAGGSTLPCIRAPRLWRNLLRWAAAIALASLLMLGMTMLRYPAGGFSRGAFLIQGLAFTLPALGLRAILHWSVRRSDTPGTSWRWQQVWTDSDWIHLFRQALAYFVPVGAGLGAFLVFNHFYFGASMPISGQIKGWWGSLETVYGFRARNYQEFLGLSDNGPWSFAIDPLRAAAEWLGGALGVHPNLVLYALIALLVVLGSMALSKSGHTAGRPYIPFAAAALFHAANYTMTGYVGYREWYWLPEILVTLLLGLLVLDVLTKPWQKKRFIPSAAAVFSCVLVVGLVFYFAAFNRKEYPLHSADRSDPLAGVRALEEQTEPGSRIGMTGSGMYGYFIRDRVVVNMDGLINGTEYFDHLQAMTIDDYLQEAGVTYLLGRSYILRESEPYRAPLQGRLLETSTIIEEMTLYHLLPDEAQP